MSLQKVIVIQFLAPDLMDRLLRKLTALSRTPTCTGISIIHNTKNVENKIDRIKYNLIPFSNKTEFYLDANRIEAVNGTYVRTTSFCPAGLAHEFDVIARLSAANHTSAHRNFLKYYTQVLQSNVSPA